MLSKLFKLVVPSRLSGASISTENTSHSLSASAHAEIEFDISLDASFDCNGVVTDIKFSG